MLPSLKRHEQDPLEPLANYRRVVDAVHRICDPAPSGLGISQRSVTVSTVGLVPAIRKLADERMQVRLAVSLHTPDDEVRDTLVPVNTRWPMTRSCGRPVTTPTRRAGVSIEYALIRDINDQPWRADCRRLRATRRPGLIDSAVIPSYTHWCEDGYFGPG
jgi:23S rRNA (adenine2503-C2)-methyltransferase